MTEDAGPAAPAPEFSPADFVPPGWLENRHLQSVWPSLPLRRRGVLRGCATLIAASRPVMLDCGEGVRLSALHANQQASNGPAAARLAVLLHGWEGSANSLYVLSLGQYLFNRGYDVLRLNLRDHGDSHHLNEGIFHSCRIAEVVGAVRCIQDRNPDRAVSLVGFSLGGNFSLRVGARAAEAGLDLDRIVAVCPVLDPVHTLARLEDGWALYRRYFVWKWQTSLARKQLAWPGVYDLREVRRMANLTRMTDHLARVYGGFPSLDALFDRMEAISGVGDPEWPDKVSTELRQAHLAWTRDDVFERYGAPTSFAGGDRGLSLIFQRVVKPDGIETVSFGTSEGLITTIYFN